MEQRNDIVIYRSEDGLVIMEALVDASGETIWATQKAIAALFGVGVNTINYHIKRFTNHPSFRKPQLFEKIEWFEWRELVRLLVRLYSII